MSKVRYRQRIPRSYIINQNFIEYLLVPITTVPEKDGLGTTIFSTFRLGGGVSST